MTSKIKGPIFILRIFLGLVFLSAGLYRAFHVERALLEFGNIVSGSLIYPLIYLVIILEIIGGLFLIFNFKTRTTTLVFFIFILLVIVESLIFSRQEIVSGFGELFFYNTNATDFFLHITYLIILSYLLAVYILK